MQMSSNENLPSIERETELLHEMRHQMRHTCGKSISDLPIGTTNPIHG
jgi:hypothetical protein